ncbi:MAG: transglutaminase domain-containing protein [Huintestinicola sp.]
MNKLSFLRKTALYLAAAVIAASGTGCSKKPAIPDEETAFTVISDGEIITTASVNETKAEGSDRYSDVSSTELYIPEHMVTKYASLSYDSRHKAVYNDVVKNMTEFSPTMLLPLTISVEDYVKILETVRCEQLMLFALESREIGDFNADAQSFNMVFNYRFDIREANIMLMQTEDAANAIFEEYIVEGMSDYDKLKIFHDYLVLNCESSTDAPYADTIYGALVNKKALCEGYAKAFSYLCNIAGIENIIVTGYTTVDHMWNMVKLDGSWYHVDVGWDSPDDALKELYPDIVLYQYFLADDSVITESRTISSALFTPPAAESTEMSYFVHDDRYASSYEEVLDILDTSCRKCIDTGEKYFMIKLSDPDLYEKTTEQLIKPDESGISDIDRLLKELNYLGQISYIDCFQTNRIIIFILDQ